VFERRKLFWVPTSRKALGPIHTGCGAHLDRLRGPHNIVCGGNEGSSVPECAADCPHRCNAKVNPFKAQWLLYVPPGLTLTNSTFCPHSVFMCYVWISEQTAIISLYSIN
jgi:hypothetical protein